MLAEGTALVLSGLLLPGLASLAATSRIWHAIDGVGYSNGSLGCIIIYDILDL